MAEGPVVGGPTSTGVLAPEPGSLGALGALEPPDGNRLVDGRLGAGAGAIGVEVTVAGFVVNVGESVEGSRTSGGAVVVVTVGVAAVGDVAIRVVVGSIVDLGPIVLPPLLAVVLAVAW